MSYYLGPDRSWWTPSSWRDIGDAATAGTLDETQRVELKAALPASSKPANLELARDLASLAVDGGLLVIGIEDDKGKAGAVTGVDLAGVADRVDQVARDRVHPPLVVRGTREVLNRAIEGPIYESNRYVATWNAGFLASADMMEAIGSTLEKREARYTGR